MRSVLAVAFLLFLPGCVSDDRSDSGDEPGDRPGYRDGVVLTNEEFTASAAQPGRFEVTFPAGTREVILEIQQDSGVMPNLHVAVEGCGEVDTPASASWQAYPLCDAPPAGEAQVTISVKVGAPAGSGRFLIRADLPS
jgi:hypothetical protein